MGMSPYTVTWHTKFVGRLRAELVHQREYVVNGTSTSSIRHNQKRMYLVTSECAARRNDHCLPRKSGLDRLQASQIYTSRLCDLLLTLRLQHPKLRMQHQAQDVGFAGGC